MNNPRIVVLDGHASNPGDLSWDALHAIGTAQIFERTPDDELIARARDAQIILVNKVQLSAAVLEQLPSLRYVGVLATGYDIVDVKAAAQRGVVVTNVPAYSSASVAQLTFALLLELTHHVGRHWDAARSGRWTRSGDFAYWETPLIELDGLVLGIVGYGRIGRAVAATARTFGMRVVAAQSSAHSSTDDHEDVERVPLDELFAQADVVSLHCPSRADNRGMVNAQRLASMKSNAFLINTARGALVDEAALLHALERNIIAGAALDVLREEPPPVDHPLLAHPRCIVTPHIAWASLAARKRLMTIAIDNLRGFLAGAPRNVVS